MGTPGACLHIRHLGRREYVPVWEQMKAFTLGRGTQTRDEAWVVEHEPVFTLGLNGRREHVLAPGEIPLVGCDRGGQVTYHGPGQIVIYLLLDLRRSGLGVRALVTRMERAVIGFLAAQGITAQARPDAPGVYVDSRKIAALGLRVTRGCSYHGLAFNLDMDLAPFGRIDPCGHAGLEVTQLRDLGVGLGWEEASWGLCRHLARELGYTGELSG
jgi:lipoyl(octanoyl) transferase